MMFNGHTMSVVTNLSMVSNVINNNEFVTVAAITTSDYPPHPNIYNGSILMPSTEILMRWADGDILVLQNEYPRYLSTKEPDDMIVALLAAMTKKNIVLYIPQDEFKIFGQYLLQHIYYMYGIVCNFGNTKFSADLSKVPFIITKFYLLGVMDANDYLDAYPGNYAIPAVVIPHLADDLNLTHMTYEDCAAYLNKIIASKVVEKKLMTKDIDSP